MFDSVVKNVLVPLLLRLALGAIFIHHGLGKISQDTEWGASWMKPPPPAATSEAGSSSSAPVGEPKPPPSRVLQMAVAWGELVGGIALVVGFLTRLAALGIIAIMIGAIVTVHWPKFSMREG